MTSRKPATSNPNTAEVNTASSSAAFSTVSLIASLKTAGALFVLLTVLTGIVYPLGITAVATVAFPAAARGSVIQEGDKLLGSEWIGQSFESPRYFWGRPSASTPAYNGMGGSGSNQATTNPALREAVITRRNRLRAADPTNTSPVPIDLVTASASGLDPHISPAAAKYQAARIARVRGLPLERVQSMIDAQTLPPTLGFLGQPRVHILRLNRSLDSASSSTANPAEVR